MQFIMDIWNFLNGHKTEYAGYLLVIATSLSGLESGLNLHVPFIDGLIGILTQIGTWLGGAGLLHKMARSLPSKTAPPVDAGDHPTRP